MDWDTKLKMLELRIKVRLRLRVKQVKVKSVNKSKSTGKGQVVEGRDWDRWRGLLRPHHSRYIDRGWGWWKH